MTEAGTPAGTPAGTRLYRREPGTWGVPSEKLAYVDYVLDVVAREFGLGRTVRAVKWFHEADALALDGDAGVFRAPVGEAGHVARAEPDVIWLRRELCAGSDGVLARILIHEICHVEQLRQPGVTGRSVEDLERAADDVVALLCEGLAG